MTHCPAMRPRPLVKASHLAPTPELFAPAETVAALKAEAGELPFLGFERAPACDLELLMNGGSPR